MRQAQAALMIVLAVVLTSCGASDDTGSSKGKGTAEPMDKTSVSSRIDELIKQATADMKPSPRLTPMRGGVHPCLDPSDGGSEDRITLTKNYWLDDVPVEVAKQLAQHAFDRWKQAGHSSEDTPKWEKKIARAHLRSVPDDYLMQIVIAKEGKVNIGVTSPCFWDKEADEVKAPVPESLGTPSPKTKDELRERQAYIGNVQMLSSAILDSLAGGWPARDEGSDPYVWVAADGTLSGRHDWTYTCEDAGAAIDAMASLRTNLLQRGWNAYTPNEDDELAAVPEEDRADYADVLRESQALRCPHPSRNNAHSLVELFHGSAVIHVKSIWV